MNIHLTRARSALRRFSQAAVSAATIAGALHLLSALLPALFAEKHEGTKMRVLLVAFFALASLAPAHAQENVKKTESCNYEIKSGYSYAVPVGESLCWRVPPPFSKDEYTLLRCDPPFREIVRVRRGDSRCNRYEERP